ncbi:MAG: ATP-binding protein [Deltaproteobacteria bacterium]|nr:MAG: ATP-binding protein [Deltaproteobacteria bacterium]
MEEYRRVLDLRKESKSIFLFGPRQTGKTYWLKKLFPESPFYNLLHADVFFRLNQKPHLIREEVLAKQNLNQPIIVDEIQKIPSLLDEIQSLIEDHKVKFILTGSSARKLKRSDTNLLGGRARVRHFYPLVSAEISHFDLSKALNYGTLPSIYNSDDPEWDLETYVGVYLQEEIKAEGLTRKIENFTRFLQIAALYNAEILNFANVSNDCAVPHRTVFEYFSILEDTLVGHLLPPYSKTKKRKAITTSKFYFFDVGVSNFLAGRKNIKPKTELFGKTLEHFIYTEIKAYLSYRHDTRPLSYWHVQSDHEVDFLIGDEVAIEVKGTENVSERHMSGIKALSEEIKLKKKIIVSNDPHPRKVGDIMILPIKVFLENLWSDKY